LDLMAAERGLTIACLVAALDADRPPGHPLASLLRVTALQHAHQNQRPSAISDVSLT
jgi:predicted DNA-binding ribbon-helix-helix protein